MAQAAASKSLKGSGKVFHAIPPITRALILINIAMFLLDMVVGDALILMFGAPTDQPDHAERAVACSLALDAYSEAFRARWLERDVMIGATRIGINSGPALVGSFGGERFFDYTAYGDTISIAARLETANKQLGTRICASGNVVERAANFRGRPPFGRR